jgi:hypothetical protein
MHPFHDSGWDTKDWLQAVDIMVTALVGIGATLAAWWVGGKAANIAQRQAEISTEQNKVGLFKTRFELYESYRKLVWAMSTPSPLDELRELSVDFVRQYRAARFLFGEEIGAHFNEVMQRGRRLISNEEMREPLDRGGPKNSELWSKSQEMAKWFRQLSENIEERFLPYMGFHKLK